MRPIPPEEIGLVRGDVEVPGFLDCHQVGSGFRAVPVVGWSRHHSHAM